MTAPILYLGDGVYATIEDKYMIKLMTTRADGAPNVIYLEPDVYANLIEFGRAQGFREPEAKQP